MPLFIGDRSRQRHDYAADPDSGEFRDGERTAAADNQIGIRVRVRDVRDKGDACRGNASLRIGAA